MSRFLCLVVGLALIGCSQQKYEGTNNKAGDELNKGMAFFDKQDFEKAIPHFTEAIKLDPKLAMAFSNRGGAYLSIGKHEAAIGDCTEAIKLDPKLAVAYYIRGVAYKEKGDPEKARADVEMAKKLGLQLQ